MKNKSSGSPKSISVSFRLYLIRNIRELNLFSNNPFWSLTLNTSEQILSTRLFLLFLLISLLSVITYTSLIIRTHTITLGKFSLADFEQFQSRYPTTINVPCTQVSNPYHKFIQLSIKFHPICSSPFIDDKWIFSLFLPNASYHNALDFRTFAFAQFQALALYCHTAREIVQDGYRIFNSTHLVTGHVFSRIEFNEIIDVLISNFRTNLLENANRTAKIVSLNIAQNGLMSALRTNSYIQAAHPSGSFYIQNKNYLIRNATSLCNCRLRENQCTYPASIFYNLTLSDMEQQTQSDPSTHFPIPGWMAGCLPMESIRQSTFECLYNQSCIDILSLQPNISRPKPLPQPSSKFPSNLTVGSMFDESLFIESWQNTTSFEDYFTVCAPRSLSYTYQGRFRLATIFTMCVSAFGGLVIIWELFIPVVIKVWNLCKWKKHQPIHLDQKETSKPRKQVVTSCIHRTIYTFNLFPPDDADDIEEQKVGIFATRLYILFLLCGLVILGFYTSLMKRTQTHTILSPSLIQFQELRSLYGSSLICPCSRFSMSYSRVMSISPQYHPICSSEFIQKSWLSYFDLIEINSNTTFFLGFDFRISGQAFFSIMRDLCQTAKETVENSIRSFQSRRLVTVNVLSSIQFNNELKIRLKRFEQETIASYVNLPKLFRSSFHTNYLVTDLLTSARFSSLFDYQTSKWIPIFHSQDTYNNSCSCAFSSQCFRSQGFYLQTHSNDFDLKIIIPGLVLSCYTIDSLLLSTLECLFQEKCIKLLLDLYDYDAVGLLRPLDIRTTSISPLRREDSRFSPNTTMESIVSQLFIEDWRSSKNFTAYYDRCEPKQCTYRVKRRFDWTYMITRMLGFYSGLSVILEITLPYCVRFIRRQWKKQRRNLEPSDKRIDLPTDNKTFTSCRKIYQSIRSLNLFTHKLPSTDERMKYEEIIATRIYIILFLLSLIVALLYAGPLSDETHTISIKSPTLNTVNDLYAKNISTLSCPCSTAAIRHSKFLSILPQYHSICSSHYANSSYWMDLFQKGDRISTQLGIHYRVLASLCEQAHRIIKTATDIFGVRELVSAETITHSSFLIRTEALISTFISQTPADYRRILTFIMRSFGVNHLLNVFTNNWELDFTTEAKKHTMTAYPHRFSPSNCTCATSFHCTEQVLGDIVTGCFPFDGFRLSKFENQSLGQLNDELFIEKWKNKSNYTAYFQACHPLECRYTLPDKNNPMTMLITVLGLYGGLTYALRLIIGQSLHAYRWWTKHHIRTTTSTNVVAL